MTNNNKHTRVVYNINYAAQLQRMGYKMLKKVPNPANLKFDMWIFEVDDTFNDDLERIIEGGKKNGR